MQALVLAVMAGALAGLTAARLAFKAKVGLPLFLLSLVAVPLFASAAAPAVATPAAIMVAVLYGFAAVWLSMNLWNLYPMVKAAMTPPLRPGDYSYAPAEHPTVTLLIPAYREAQVIQQCLQRVFQSDYPRDRYDVLLLTEADDHETQAAVDVAVEKFAADGFRIGSLVVRENGSPRGKPRALVQGLEKATGEVVGVLDAEDLIDSMLLSKVAAVMEVGGYEVVQGILDMVNEEDGWRNRQFRAEYGYWYRHYMPMLTDSGLPVPLGGTTNFFKKSVFSEVGTWDPWNVTEDYDLGMRLFLHKKKVGMLLDASAPRTAESIYSVTSVKTVGMIRSVTVEESPRSLDGFIRQRTRWQRGKMQTMAKLAGSGHHDLRARLLVLYSGLFPHLGAVNLTGMAMSAAAFFLGAPLPPLFYAVAAFNALMIPFYGYNQYRGYLSATEETTPRRRAKGLATALTLPAYWALQWYADLRAIKQHYLDAPFRGGGVHWEKTTHEGRNLLRSGLLPGFIIRSAGAPKRPAPPRLSRVRARTPRTGLARASPARGVRRYGRPGRAQLGAGGPKRPERQTGPTPEADPPD